MVTTTGLFQELRLHTGCTAPRGRGCWGSRLKTSLPWVPPDTKLSKLDTLRLASSYIAHLRQLLQEDRYENGYVHPVNLVGAAREARAGAVE